MDKRPNVPRRGMNRLIATACIVGCLAFGCAPKQTQSTSDADDLARMDSIVRIALEKVSKPLERDLIGRGETFVNLADLDVPCVGLRVPLPGSDRKIFLSFTKEWFDDNSDAAVADCLINDLERVLGDLESQSTSN